MGDEVIEETKIVPTNFNEKKMSAKHNCLYFICFFINCHCISDSC